MRRSRLNVPVSLLLSACLVAFGCGQQPEGGSAAGTTDVAPVAGPTPATATSGGASTGPIPQVEDVLLITIDTLRADALGYADRLLHPPF